MGSFSASGIFTKSACVGSQRRPTGVGAPVNYRLKRVPARTTALLLLTPNGFFASNVGSR